MKYLLTIEFEFDNTVNEYSNLSFDAVQDILKAQDVAYRYLSDPPNKLAKTITITPDYIS